MTARRPSSRATCRATTALTTGMAAVLWTACAPPGASAQTGPSVTIVTGDTLTRRCYRKAADGAASEYAIDLCSRAHDQAERLGLVRNRTASIVNRGVVRYNRGQYGHAAADFGTAIDAYATRNPHVLVNRGLAYEAWRPGDAHLEALARADYEAALQRSPKHGLALRRLEELGKPYLERTPASRTLIAGGRADGADRGGGLTRGPAGA